MSKVIALIAVAVVIGGGWILLKNSGIDMGVDSLNVNSINPAAQVGSDVKEFNVVGTPFAFDLKAITVKKGDTVKINFTNFQGMHDWVIDEFNARTKVLQTGQSETITFVADKAGSFEYYCSVGTHRQQGMVGTLIVEE